MKRFAIACVAVVGLMVAGSSAANAGGYRVSVGHGGTSVGHGYAGGHSGFYGGNRGLYGGHGYTPHVPTHSRPRHTTFPSPGVHGAGHRNYLHGGFSGAQHGGYLGH